MTALGIEFTEHQPVTGYEVVTRSAHFRPPEVTDARAEADAAWQRVDDLAGRIADGASGEIYYDLAQAQIHAEACEAEYAQAWYRWQGQIAAELAEIELEGLHITMLQLAEALQ
ncbi:MAG TPA: hypothetical protein VFF68_10060 [Anaerolineaceae bacterium]|nr:hypothetical protein [Anaerolineaceae bacterium]